LSHSEINKSGIEDSSEHVRDELSSKGFRSLADFVDEESINEVTQRAELTFQQLQVRLIESLVKG
jgi:poly-D-alanine transfer protein DltD